MLSYHLFGILRLTATLLATVQSLLLLLYHWKQLPQRSSGSAWNDPFKQSLSNWLCSPVHNLRHIVSRASEMWCRFRTLTIGYENFAMTTVVLVVYGSAWSLPPRIRHCILLFSLVASWKVRGDTCEIGSIPNIKAWSLLFRKRKERNCPRNGNWTLPVGKSADASAVCLFLSAHYVYSDSKARVSERVQTVVYGPEPCVKWPLPKLFTSSMPEWS